MRRKKLFASILLCCSMVATCLPIKTAHAQTEAFYDIYVSEKGSDETGNGTRQKPYATIEKARQAARGKHGTAQSPVKVYVEAGKYFVPDTVKFTEEDSNVTYIGNDAVLTGAKNFSGLEWSSYKNGIQVADVGKDLGIDQLFVNGQQQILARYPNYNADQPLQGSTTQADIKERTKNWKNPEGGYIRALHDKKWGGNSYKITGKDNSSIGLSYTWVGDNNRGSGMDTGNVMVENIFEELDSPGEWYYDNVAGKLYICPLEKMDLNKAVVEGATTEELLHIEGKTDGAKVSNITFDGFTLENTKRTMFTGKYIPLMRSDWCVVRKGALYIENAENITFQNGVIRNIGGNGVFLSGHSKNVVIDNNEILNIGSSGILVAGYPDSCREPSFWDQNPKPEVEPYHVHKTTVEDTTPGPAKEHYPREAVISNNHIQNVGIWEKQSSQVALSTAYKIQILHNTIHEGPRAGINIGDGTFGGHEIAYNDVFDVQKETDDHGMFNSWGRDRFWSLGGYDTMGNNGAAKEPFSRIDVIDKNTIHDNRMHFGGRVDGGSTFGIDLDDGSSNYDIYNNLCLNMGIKLREGFHRKVHNNILVNGVFNLHCTFENSTDEIGSNIVIKGNPYVLAATGKERFEKSKDQIDKNGFYDFGMKITLPDFWDSLSYDKNSVNLDPKFEDSSKNNYTVTNEELMKKIGFKNFPMDQFGKPGCKYQAPIYEKTQADGNQDIYEREEWLGATISALDDAIMSSTGAGGLEGVYMENVPEDSQAAKYGFKTGDVLKTINGKEIGKKSTFTSKYDEISNGSIVNFVLVRNQLRMELNYIKIDSIQLIDDQNNEIIYSTGKNVTWETSKPGNNPSNASQCIEKTMTYTKVDQQNRKDAIVSVPFHGTQIEFISRKENNMGDYKFVIKDEQGKVVQEEVASAHTESQKDQQSIFKSKVLPYAKYTLTMTCESGDYLIVDAFKVSSIVSDQDAVVVEPIKIMDQGVRVTELTSGRTLEITVPIINRGNEELHLIVASAISGNKGAHQTESVDETELALEAGKTENVTFTIQTPENSEQKKLDIFVYNANTKKPYSYKYTVAGKGIIGKDVSIEDASNNEIAYSYSQKDGAFTVAANDFKTNGQAIVVLQDESGKIIGIKQVVVDNNGQAKAYFTLSDELSGKVNINIVDETGAFKTKEITLDANENVVDKEGLKNAVETARNIVENEESIEKYTNSTWKPFYKAYYDALAALDNNKLTQDELNQITVGLKETQAALQERVLQTSEDYAPSKNNVHAKFEIYKKDGTADGGNRDAQQGDEWQVRDAQVDTTVKDSYAEFKGNFTSFKIHGANKEDSADFKVMIIDDETSEEKVVEVSQTKDQGANTVLIFDAGELSGRPQTVKVYHNDQDGRYLELRGIEYTEVQQSTDKIPMLEKIEITKTPEKTEYVVGDEKLELVGGEITETYKDQSTNTIPMNQMMYKEGFDTETEGIKNITLLHRGMTDSFEVTVNEVVEYYTLTVQNGTGSGKYTAGTEINITADKLDGMKFIGWECDLGQIMDPENVETVFIMPEGNVTVVAKYEKEENGNDSGEDPNEKPNVKPDEKPDEKPDGRPEVKPNKKPSQESSTLGNDKVANNVLTGDHSNIGVVLCIALISGIAMTVLIIKKRNKKVK